MISIFQLDTKKKARTYSKGNRQKIALIAALSQEADLYIFDEPTSGLDPLNEKSFQTEVFKLKKAGKSVLLSSHILSEVEKMCDKIAIIREGEIIESGDLTEMRHLTRMEVTVTTKEPLTELAEQKGVHKVSFNNTAETEAVFSVDQEEMTGIMNYLSSKAVLAITATPPTLEDLFLRYYGEVSADA